tara:strand:- start:603 stop:878 length:276 start_codon:yes stop_codon:yes gene_type:complete
MNRILYDFGGNAPTVVLTEDDKEQIREKLKPINKRKFAEAIGIGRSHVYGLLAQHRMELLRFAQICKFLDLKLLSQEDVDSFITSVKERIS